MTSDLAVLALVTDAFGGRGGIAQYNRDFLGTLAHTQSKEVPAISEITVLPRRTLDQVLSSKGIRQKPARQGPFTYALSAMAVAVTQRVDVIFCGHLYMAPLAALIARLKGSKLIVQTHGIEAWPRPTWLQRAALESADLVLCVSRYTRARVLDWAAITPERVLVVPNTVGDMFTPSESASLRTSMGFEGKRVLLTVGRMDSRERYKGQDRVIDAIPKLLADGHDVHYVIIGVGDDRPRLEMLARQAGLNERVHFIGEFERQRLNEAYRMADLFVMPSSGEGFGITFVEAMASGTPALGLAVAGARDALADGELGTTVSEADLATTISRLLAHPQSDPDILAAQVRARFGEAAFSANVCGVMKRLFSKPSISASSTAT